MKSTKLWRRQLAESKWPSRGYIYIYTHVMLTYVCIYVCMYVYIYNIYMSQLSSNQHEQEVAACRCVHIPAVSAHCGQAQTRRWWVESVLVFLLFLRCFSFFVVVIDCRYWAHTGFCLPFVVTCSQSDNIIIIVIAADWVSKNQNSLRLLKTSLTQWPPPLRIFFFVSSAPSVLIIICLNG